MSTEQNHKFKEGDVVTLNSGSFPMTVSGVIDDKTVECTWFSSPSCQHVERFTTASLRRYNFRIVFSHKYPHLRKIKPKAAGKVEDPQVKEELPNASDPGINQFDFDIEPAPQQASKEYPDFHGHPGAHRGILPGQEYDK